MWVSFKFHKLKPNVICPIGILLPVADESCIPVRGFRLHFRVIFKQYLLITASSYRVETFLLCFVV